MLDASPQQAGFFQHKAVDVQDMAAGVQHAHSAGRADAVQVMPADPLGAKVDRVEAPAQQGAIGLPRAGAAQLADHCLQRPAAWPVAAIWVTQIKIAAVGVAPQATGHQVGMGFDQPGQQHLVGKAVVKLMRAPALEFVDRADAQNAAVAHRHVGGVWARCVHGDDLARRINSGLHGGQTGRTETG